MQRQFSEKGYDQTPVKFSEVTWIKTVVYSTDIGVTHVCSVRSVNVRDANADLMWGVNVVHVDIVRNHLLHFMRLGQTVLSTAVAEVSALRKDLLPSRTQSCWKIEWFSLFDDPRVTAHIGRNRDRFVLA